VTSLRLYADFNEITTKGACWLLYFEQGTDECYERVSVDDLSEKLNLQDGLRVILHQDEPGYPPDFEINATLKYEHVEEIGRKSWVAYPDDASIRRFQGKQWGKQ
jgi:hypothetical protein